LPVIASAINVYYCLHVKKAVIPYKTDGDVHLWAEELSGLQSGTIVLGKRHPDSANMHDNKYIITNYMELSTTREATRC
jgi:hypothetical protein